MTTGGHAQGTDDMTHWRVRYTNVCMEVQQEQSMEVLRSVVGDMSLCLGGGCTPLQGTGKQMGLWLQPY